jgi:hypothetical protein
MQQQESDDEDNSTNRSGLSFPGSLSELFNERDSQQIGDLLGGFILQLIKMSLIQYRSCTTERSGPGG